MFGGEYVKHPSSWNIMFPCFDHCIAHSWLDSRKFSLETAAVSYKTHTWCSILLFFLYNSYPTVHNGWQQNNNILHHVWVLYETAAVSRENFLESGPMNNYLVKEHPATETQVLMELDEKNIQNFEKSSNFFHEIKFAKNFVKLIFDFAYQIHHYLPLIARNLVSFW